MKKPKIELETTVSTEHCQHHLAKKGLQSHLQSQALHPGARTCAVNHQGLCAKLCSAVLLPEDCHGGGVGVGGSCGTEWSQG